MLKNLILQVAQKGPDTRRLKSRGVRRTPKYAAISTRQSRGETMDEGNAGDGPFSGTC
jgi:hypothetical protein